MAHGFDGMVFIPNCDKIVPGMLMAARRLNLPAMVISGGPMMPGRLPGGGDQQVVAPERFEIAAHGLFAADVGRERRAAAACRLAFAAERFEPFATPSRRYDVVAFRREPERRGASDSRGGSRDECLFIHDDSQKTVLSGKNTKLCVTLHKFSDKIPLS